MWTALSMCSQVWVVGFGTCAGNAGGVYYERSREFENFSVYHDMPLEYQWLQDLHKGGVIKLMDLCAKP